jgi:hypothetical protein
MQVMRWLSCSGLVLMIACSPRPERVDPFDFPGSSGDTGVVPIPNTCETRTHSFESTASGHFDLSLSGYAVYEYEAVPDRLTAIYLTACEPEVPTRFISLAFYGIDRVEVGEHAVDRFAEEEGGFLFSYTDTSSAAPAGCNQLPTGTVTVTDSGFGQIAGSFNVTTLCDDETTEGRRPGETVFTGTFAANNVGVE